MPQETMSAEELQRRTSRYAGLTRIDVDVKGQRVDVAFEVQLDREDPWYDIRLRFSKVCYFRTASDLRYASHEENVVHVFAERFGERDDLIVDNDGWATLVTDIGSMTLANPREAPPRLRHFVVSSGFIAFELLCVGVDIQIGPSQISSES